MAAKSADAKKTEPKGGGKRATPSSHLSRRLLLGGAALAIAGYGLYALWQSVRPQVETGPHYRLTVDDVHVPPLPPWIHCDVRREVLRDAGIDGAVSLLDEGLVERLAKAFALHPWVAKVERVSKSPAAVTVELVYRRPACMVEVPGGLFPVDDEGYLLPTADFAPSEAARYPRLSGIPVVTEGPVGTRWHDTRVMRAARIASALRELWNELNLNRIVPVAAAEQPAPDAEPQFEIYTNLGTRIVWGAAGQGRSAAEPDDAEKASRLRKYATEHGSLEGSSGPQTLDVRGPGGPVASPRTASNSDSVPKG